VGFQVIECGDGFGPGTTAYATLGLSRHTLHSRASGRVIRQELIIAARESGPTMFPGILQQVGMEVLESHHAPSARRGVGTARTVAAGFGETALYVSMPAYLPDDSWTCPSEEGDVHLAWLVPVTTSEAEYVTAHGWSAFADRLVEVDPDLLDLRRAPVV
jgi:hypothetical protein